MATKFCQLVVLLALISILSAQVCSSNQFTTNGGVTCTNCPSTCPTCNSLQFCSSCIKDYFLVNNGFSVLCKTCSQIYRGCLSCTTNIACLSCDRGYFLENTVCVPCSSRLPNCAACTAGGAACTVCAFPYILINGVCQSTTISGVIGGASVPSNTTTNTTNTTNLIILPNGVLANITLDSNGCNQLQIFLFGTCLRLINNCQSYHRTGLCAVCLSNWVLTVYGDCAPNTPILRCNDGFWLNTALNRCIQVHPSCDWYYEINGSCFNCTTGYKYENFTCVQNVTCNQRQYFLLGRCADVQAQCAKFVRQTGVCTECAFGYVLSNGLCNLSATLISLNNCAFPCKTCHWDRLTYCFSCHRQYQLVGATYGSCKPVIY